MGINLKMTKEFKPFFLTIMAYAIGIGVPYIFQYVIKFRVPFTFWVSEQELQINYDISMKLFMDFAFSSPFFAVCSYFGFRSLINRMPEEDFSKRFKNISISIFMIFVAIFAMGQVIHIVANHLNGIAFNMGIVETDLYYAIYFWDEFVGHTTIAVGFYGVFLLIGVLEILLLNNSTKGEPIRIIRSDQLWALAIGAIAGLVQASAFLEGQCNFIFLIVNPIALLSFYLISRKYEFDYKQSTFVLALISLTIAYSIFTIIWAGLYGVKPYYPFFFQGSEV